MTGDKTARNVLKKKDKPEIGVPGGPGVKDNGQYKAGEVRMSLDDLVGEMSAQADKLKELNHSVLFDLGDEGKILLDATGGEVKITPNPESEDAETTLVLSSDNLVKLVNGDLNPMVAFTLGKLKVFGSKGIALKLSSLLDK
ncbi:MAG: SCP2 sterol-binding domain-containing protein [Rhodospirillaceae bacterium]